MVECTSETGISRTRCRCNTSQHHRGTGYSKSDPVVGTLQDQRPESRDGLRLQFSSFHTTSVQQLIPHLIYSTKASHGTGSCKQQMWIHNALQRVGIMYKTSGSFIYHLIFYVLGQVSALTGREVATTQK